MESIVMLRKERRLEEVSEREEGKGVQSNNLNMLTVLLGTLLSRLYGRILDGGRGHRAGRLDQGVHVGGEVRDGCG